MILEFRSPRGLGTTIYADFQKKQVQITNHTDDILDTAFGINRHPTWEDFEKFLESRCVSKTRHHLDWELAEIGVDHYDPLLIIEKTAGRMAEDDNTLLIVEKESEHEYEISLENEREV